MKYNSFNEPELSFQYDFGELNWAEFAFTYPYSYADCQKMLKEMSEKYSLHQDIYFHH